MAQEVAGRRAGVIRNVLLVTADQWRGDCLSALGHPQVRTPNFDRLAAGGVAYRNHYSVCAPCGPARASLLTGMYLHNHRSVRNGTPLEDRHANLAREMRRAGFRPVLFGYTDTTLDPRAWSHDKVIEHGYENVLPGFDAGLHLPAERPEAWLAFLRSRGHDIHDYAGAFTPAHPPLPGSGRTLAPARYDADSSQTAFLVGETIDYLAGAEPGWFAHLSWFRPHPPFLAPAPWNTMYAAADSPPPVRRTTPSAEAELHPWVRAALGANGDWFDPWTREILGGDGYDEEVAQIRATYYGLIGKVDHYFGELMAFLERSGRLRDTLVVVTSDHGELLGDHYLFGKRGFFDQGFHIPLIVHDPGLGDACKGTVVDAFTESVDIMPTILARLGLPVPAQCDGRPLPGLAGDQAVAVRDAAHWEYDFRNDGHAGGAEAELGLGPRDCLLNVIRDCRYKYVHFTGLAPLLFDIGDDPTESRDLSQDPAYRAVVADYAGRLLSWRMRHDEPALTSLVVDREGIRDRGGVL